MTTSRKIARINATIFFLFWLLVLLAGADKPPPPGFLLLALVIAVCAVVVYWRTPTYIHWQRTQRRGRYGRVLLDGIVAGLVLALLFALKGPGKGTPPLRALDYVIWFAIVGTMGIINAMALYAITAVLTRAAKPSAATITRSNCRRSTHCWTITAMARVADLLRPPSLPRY